MGVFVRTLARFWRAARRARWAALLARVALFFVAQSCAPQRMGKSALEDHRGFAVAGRPRRRRGRSARPSQRRRPRFA
eukprot:3379250-Pyramimonas_sp.AAC.1